MSDRIPQMHQTEVKPTPDPTVLTTEQLLREIDRVVKLLEAKMDGQHDTLAAQVMGLADRVDSRFAEYRQSEEIRFAGITHEFDLVESRRVEQKTDTKVAVDAAFSAQKDAVREQTAASEKAIAKSESSTKEQATQQYATITAELKAIRDNVSDVKNRVITIESVKLGQAETKTGARADLGSMIAIVMTVIALLGIFAAFVTRLP